MQVNAARKFLIKSNFLPRVLNIENYFQNTIDSHMNL